MCIRDSAGIRHAGQDAARDIQCLEQGVVPVQRSDVIPVSYTHLDVYKRQTYEN